MFGADLKRVLRMAGAATCACALLLSGPAEAEPSQAGDQTKTAPPDTGMVLPGGEEGTVFKDLVVEGEDLIRIQFERPELRIDVDPQSAPGLEWGSVQEILDRDRPDLVPPLVGFFAYEHLSYPARPWLDLFSSGDIVRFRPSVRDLDRWQLTVANSRGETVASFDGRGKPPEEIGWDGRTLEGQAAPPGLTYSYVLEAFDRAGNKRSFVGEGFELPPYRLENKEEVVMLFSGAELSNSANQDRAGSPVPPPILLEVADRVNQSEKVDRPIQVQATARSFERAKDLAETVVDALDPLIIGGRARIQPLNKVQADAPDEGTIQVVLPR
jgi:hypothetical protein